MQDRRTAALERRLAVGPTDMEAWVELARLVRRTGQLPESLRDGRHVGALLGAWSRAPEERELADLILGPLGLARAPGPEDRPPTHWEGSARRDQEGWYDPGSGVPLRVRLDPLSLDLVWIPSGAHPEAPDRRRLARGHWMSVLPLDQRTVDTAMADPREDAPLETMTVHPDRVPWVGSFDAARLVLGRLARRWRAPAPLPRGWRLRLPTPREWEYAAHAQGPLPPEGLDWGEFAAYDHPTSPVPGGRRAPNAFGLQDMCGNCEEWTLDPEEDGPRGEVLLALPRGTSPTGHRLGLGGSARVRTSYPDGPAAEPPGFLDHLLGGGGAPRRPPLWSGTLHPVRSGDLEEWCGIRLVLDPPPDARLEDLDLRAPPAPPAGS